MSSVADKPTPDSQQQQDAKERRLERIKEREKLRTSRFDVVTSLFLALILFIGTFVTMLFLVWLFTRFEFPPKPIKPSIEQAAGRGPNAEGTDRDFDPPAADEVEELLEPTLEENIMAVTNAVSSVAATVSAANYSATSGKGDSRPPGPMGEGEDIVARAERWQLKFSAKNINGYATQLDFYKIELGAVGGSIQGVDTAKNLAGSPQATRVVDTENEKRLYFMWTTPGPLMEYDRQLLEKAGIPLPGRQMLKFVPENLEGLLEQTEMEYAKANGHPSVKEIAKTVFESQPDGSGFKFVVVDQRYRKTRR